MRGVAAAEAPFDHPPFDGARHALDLQQRRIRWRVLLVSRPGSTPLVLFVGQIERGARGREAFQEVDYRAAFGPLAKWATEIESPERTVEVVERAGIEPFRESAYATSH